jgi:hypothetical protein
MTPEADRLLDRALPRWDFAERHRRLVRAPAPAVWRALGEVRVSDLPLTGLLMRVRALGRKPLGRADRRALDALPPGEVGRDEGRELLLGLVLPTSLRTDVRSLDALRPASVDELVRPLPDGWVRVGMDFRLEAAAGATELSTETRVLATGPAARRRFRLYWLVIRGGSGLIRRELLHAVALRAERAR